MDAFSKKPTTREKVLYMGAKLTAGDRDQTYGDPYINMNNTAQMIEAYINAKYNIGVSLSAEDAAIILSLVKISRMMNSKNGGVHMDNYVDSATYIAIAGECAEQGAGE